MKRVPSLSWLVVLAVASIASSQELVNCPANPAGSGDRIDRGLYLPSFPGTSLGVVVLHFACQSSDERTFALTARHGTYDGPILGVAQATVVPSGAVSGAASARFDFRGVPVVQGSTVTFALELLSGSPIQCFYNKGVNEGELCGELVVETEGTEPPLSVFRNYVMGITIFPGVGPVPSTSWVAVVSRADGFAGSVWRSALSLLNRSNREASITLRLHLAGVHERSLSLEAGSTVVLEDVVDWIEPGLGGSGALEVVSDQALAVLARTANTISDGAACYPGGTFGQVFDGRTVHDGLVTQESVTLSGLRELPSARTNIGFTNTGATPAEVSYTLLNAAGNEVYSSPVLTLAPGEWRQENRPFRERAQLLDVDGGWAVVKVHRGVGVQVYASLLDALTSDAATIWPTR